MQDILTLPVGAPLDLTQRVVPMITLNGAVERSPFRNARRILLPFDLSRSGVCALRIVAELAGKTGATIHLLHVVRPGEPNDADPKTNRADDHIADATERLLKHWVKRVVQGRVKTFVSIRIGDPAEVIVARAIATRADLVVMTSGSSTGQCFELQRSTAERVSRLAPCPVLTIPEKCRDNIAYTQDFLTSGWRAILLPVDFSRAAEDALRFAAQLASDMRARLILAHGCDTEEAEEANVRTRMQTWASRLLEDAHPCQTLVWPGGHSLYAILSEAVRTEADLIVLPTATQPWARRLRAGSITDGVLRQAPCPVISINEKISST